MSTWGPAAAVATAGEDEYLTGTEAARVLRVRTARLREMLDDDQVPYLETGKHAFVIRREDFDRWRLVTLPAKNRRRVDSEAAGADGAATRDLPDFLLSKSERRARGLPDRWLA